MDQVKFFKRCLSQILLGPFLNTLTHTLSFLQLMVTLDHCQIKLLALPRAVVVCGIVSENVTVQRLHCV